jgi:NAD(P)-dependent dehydrogenase (short-subunit alcohol dehydrogenase family)
MSGCRLAGQTILVTGAGRGLGKAYAEACAREGADIVVNDVDADCAEQTAAAVVQAGARAIAAPGTVASADGAQALVATSLSGFGRLDGLVNNAGMFLSGDIEEHEPGVIEDLIKTNVLGVIHCTTAALPVMRAARSGAIINVTSGAALGMKGMAIYGASKAAVMAFTFATALDLEESGLFVAGVSPVAATRMNAHIQRRTAIMEPDSVAPLIAYLLAARPPALHGRIVRLSAGELSILATPHFDAPLGARRDWAFDDFTTVLAPARTP